MYIKLYILSWIVRSQGFYATPSTSSAIHSSPNATDQIHLLASVQSEARRLLSACLTEGRNASFVGKLDKRPKIAALDGWLPNTSQKRRQIKQNMRAIEFSSERER